MEEYKKVDNEFNDITNKYKKTNSERESMYKEYIISQDKLNKLNKENQELSFNLQNYEKQINKRIVIDFNKNYETLYLEKIEDEEDSSYNNSIVSYDNNTNLFKSLFNKIKNKFVL